MKAKLVRESLNESSTLSGVIPNNKIKRVIGIFNLKHDTELKELEKCSKASITALIKDGKDVIITSNDEYGHSEYVVIGYSRKGMSRSTHYFVIFSEDGYNTASSFKDLWLNETVGRILSNSDKICYSINSGTDFSWGVDRNRANNNEFLSEWLREFSKSYFPSFVRYYKSQFTKNASKLSDFSTPNMEETMRKLNDLKYQIDQYSNSNNASENLLRWFLNSEYNLGISSGDPSRIGEELANIEKNVNRMKLMNEFAEYLLKN